MSRVRSRHPEDFELLCYTAGELEEAEAAAVLVHLEHCGRCLLSLTELRSVNSGLRALTRVAGKGAPLEVDDLPANDPFRDRPQRSARPLAGTRELAQRAIEHSRRGSAEVGSVLAAADASPADLAVVLDRLRFEDPAARYLLLYALEEAGRRLTDAPARFLVFAERVIARLAREERSREASDAEILVPLSTLFGQAHVLAGQGGIWTGELERARRHLEEAYRVLPWESDSDEIRIALAELHESQRRAFAGQPRQGVTLARRSRATFERFGMEDYSARARVAEGVALSEDGDDKRALVCFRSSAPIFESRGLWSNYVAVVNNIGFSLARLGRLDEARREFSRSLKRVSRERHPSLLAFVRHGLARVLFFGGRYSDAAKSFLQASRLFHELGQTGDELSANLWEIESWARSGDLSRARHRMEIFRAAIARAEGLDPYVLRELEEALSGHDPNLEEIARMRERVETTLRATLDALTG